MNELNMVERARKLEHFVDKTKKRRYTKTKLLELRRNKKCQEWPRIFSKKFIGIDGKWDPVGAFENNNFTQRTHSRDDIQHFYNDRFRKRQRDDYKYYWYGESTKRYSSSYGGNYSHYYPSNPKQRYQYDEDIVYESNRSRGSPDDYYPSYSYSSNKSRNTNEKESNESIANDSKPEWFTGGPSNINETIELSGMSRELEAGILKNRKPNQRIDENFTQPKKSTSDTDANSHFSPMKSDNISQMDSHLLKIIQKNAKENDKRKTSASAKEVEKVLKSILLRPNEESQETSTLSQNSNGIILTVNEIEANLKLKGNRGAGDMSAYYKLLGLVQNNFNTNPSEENKPTNPVSSKATNHTVTSTNNNHPRQFINSKYPLVNTIKNNRNNPKLTEESDVEAAGGKLEDPVNTETIEKESKDKSVRSEGSVDTDKSNSNLTSNSMKFDENSVNSDMKKVNGFNNYNIHAVNNTLKNERLAMASRNVCNPLSNQFSNHMLGTGQNAYRWIRAMNNAAAASARITQINQSDYCSTPESLNNNDKLENKTDPDSTFSIAENSSLDTFNSHLDNNIRLNAADQSSIPSQIGSYVNNFNLNNYMAPGSPLYNQLSMKQFLPFGYSQNSMFGRQFLNPYLLQQLFMHKQWENRNISLQNQLRQFQSMIFNCNTQQNAGGNTANTNPTFIPTNNMSLNQGDCSPIGASK